MSVKQVTSAVYEYACDECGRTDRRENHPEHWVTINVDSYGALNSFRNRFELCGECSHLDKYKWAWQS